MPANFNYGEVLQKSLLFYEAQRSGDLPADNRIAWRGDSALNDGSSVNRDLSGGYYDAGDHVKFVFPMAGAMTLLGWGLLEYKDGYVQSNQYDEALDALKWGTDWLLKAHETDATGTTAFWMQVGDGDDDHNVWIPPEDLEKAGSPERPAFKLDRQTPGSDVAAEAAAALAAASVVFRPHDDAYADELLENAIQLYAFADDADLNASNGKQRGQYSEVLHQQAPSIFSKVDETTGELDYYAYYNSWSGYPDELLWGATWLHKAQLADGMADSPYLDLAEQQYQQTYFNVGWTQSWDDKSQGAAILLAQLTQNQTYRNDVERWLNRWLPGEPEERPINAVDYTPGGLAVLSPWGSLRYSANTAFLAGIYADTVLDEQQDANLITAYNQFAQQQIDYALGNNPEGFSYVVGFGNDYPLQPHHRGASGITGYGADFDNANLPNAHVLYGALVGGPQSIDDADYNDSRTDFVTNEVALDYNAAFTGALARLYQQHGGEPIRDAALEDLWDNEGDVIYRPHLQVKVDGETTDLAVTNYGNSQQNADPQLNIFLDQTAQIIGNGWKKLTINYNITENTVLQFEFRSGQAGEIQGIGFDDDNTLSAQDGATFFQLLGSQAFGINQFKAETAEEQWQFYSLPIGELFTGEFQYLTLGNEQDSVGSTPDSSFRNIALFEAPRLEPQLSVIGEYGTSIINHQWQTIALNETYINPVVIVSDPTFNGGDPAAVRLRNVTSGSFQMRIQEPNYRDGWHVNESVSFVVLEAGDWALADGTYISAGINNSHRLSSAGFDTISLNGFEDTPTVLSQVQTFNGGDWVVTRLREQSSDSFQMAMQEEEALNRGGHVQESIGWLAVEQGIAFDGDTLLQGGTTERNFSQIPNQIEFEEDFGATPSVIAKLASYYGPDTANLRLNSIGSMGFGLRVREEQSLDAELAHIPEAVSFLALEGLSGSLLGLSV